MCAYLSTRPEFTIVGQSGTMDALVELLRLRRPDAALVDAAELTMPRVAALRGLREAAPGVELIVSYAQASPPVLTAAAQAGLTGLVPGSQGLEVLLRSVLQRARTPQRPGPSGLSASDMRMLALLSSGRSVREIAAQLHLSTRTVENRKRHLYVRLGVSNSSEAVSLAGARGLIDVSGGEGRGERHRHTGQPMAVLHGPPGPTMDAVWRAAIAAGVPCVHTSTLHSLDQEHWARWGRGPVVAVLVDPTHEDLLVPVVAGGARMVVLSRDPDPATLADLLLRGTGAMVRAEDVADDFAFVLSVVVRGYVAVDSSLVTELAWSMTAGRAERPTVPSLTSREVDILGSIAAGSTIRQTARQLGIAAKTVENTQARLYRKLGARNRTEALTIALRLRLLERQVAGPRR
jgi:DNA-binding NarL/FixJ family response regulator